MSHNFTHNQHKNTYKNGFIDTDLKTLLEICPDLKDDLKRILPFPLFVQMMEDPKYIVKASPAHEDGTGLSLEIGYSEDPWIIQ